MAVLTLTLSLGTSTRKEAAEPHSPVLYIDVSQEKEGKKYF